jgi:hypothetical protein
MGLAQLKSVLPRELLASVVVFLVALPLCMGIAIASGMPPAKGLITGIIGGLVVGWLAGSPLQVSGPAAGLAVLVFEVVREHGMAMLGRCAANPGGPFQARLLVQSDCPGGCLRHAGRYRRADCALPDACHV